jgi:hypothetical protein
MGVTVGYTVVGDASLLKRRNRPAVLGAILGLGALLRRAVSP